MKTITIPDFAQKAVSLKAGDEIRFQVTCEDSEKTEYFITIVEHREAFCLLANCQGGGDPFAFDITTYDTDLKKLSEALDEYINCRSKAFGSVDIYDENLADKKESVKHMLISVCEREITTFTYFSHEEAYVAMEKELEESMIQGRENYDEDSDYAIGEMSAWSNANHHVNCDWLIVRLG